MAVEKAVNMLTYQTSMYQNNKDLSQEKNTKTEETQKEETPQKNGEGLDHIPITLDDVSLKDDESEDKQEEKEEEFQKTMEDQKHLHEKIKKSIDSYSSRMGNFEAKFGVHEATNRVTIKLVDKDTKEVIKEIPPEKTLDMIAKCLEISGVLVDEKV